MMNIDDLEFVYPYVESFALEEQDDDSHWWEEDGRDEVSPVTLSNGDLVRGVNFCYEYFEYRFRARLNELGWDMLAWIQTLAQVGLIEITPSKSEVISVAPWDQRAV